MPSPRRHPGRPAPLAAAPAGRRRLHQPCNLFSRRRQRQKKLGLCMRPEPRIEARPEIVAGWRHAVLLQAEIAPPHPQHKLVPSEGVSDIDRPARCPKQQLQRGSEHHAGLEAEKELGGEGAAVDGGV
eukprot:scaffold19603_cov70-Isochrysis_galbana.AAC.1